MQSRRSVDQSDLDADSPDTKQEIRVLIACGDLGAGRRAMRVLTNLGKGLAEIVMIVHEQAVMGAPVLQQVHGSSLAPRQACNEGTP